MLLILTGPKNHRKSLSASWINQLKSYFSTGVLKGPNKSNTTFRRTDQTQHYLIWTSLKQQWCQTYLNMHIPWLQTSTLRVLCTNLHLFRLLMRQILDFTCNALRICYLKLLILDTPLWKYVWDASSNSFCVV